MSVIDTIKKACGSTGIPGYSARATLKDGSDDGTAFSLNLYANTVADEHAIREAIAQAVASLADTTCKITMEVGY